VVLTRLAQTGKLPQNAVLISQLPVNRDLAPTQVIAQIQIYRPKLVICCGMAERRQHLTLELQGVSGQESLKTGLNLKALVRETVQTQISQDAGRFVCNHLYYQILSHLKHHHPACQALFVHIPIVTTVNWPVVEFDFLRILDRLNTQ
jgi:pyroglutamyl-peptidase